jgi:hypothetical protein
MHRFYPKLLYNLHEFGELDVTDSLLENSEADVKGAAPRFPSEDKERLLSEILRSCQN